MSGDLLISWIDASGTEWPFNGESNYLATEGAIGLTGMPPIANTEAKTPLTDGAVLRFTLADVRVVDLPILVTAPTYADLYAANRALRQALNPKRGKGIIRVTAPDGAVRDLNCVYNSGFEEDLGKGFSSYQQAVLVFRAQDPYLYDRDATIQTFYGSSAPNFFPILPIRLGTSSVLSSFSIDNLGDVEAYPVFVIQGPGSGIVLTNNTTGKKIDLTANGGLSLLSTDTLTIDTQARTVTKQDGTSQYNHLTFASALWALAQGINSISVTMAGTTSASFVQVQYKQRYLGA